MSGSKVERLAALIDDKTMISTLIREGSDRIRLIEFKDARADIWHYFRLVQLDGLTLPYAVCIRCMKPVSYKAREGTGGLHRHPCSKASVLAAGGALVRSAQRGLNFSRLYSSSLGLGSTSAESPSSKALTILPHSSFPSPTYATYDQKPVRSANGATEEENGTRVSPEQNASDESTAERSIANALCNHLIPTKVLNDESFLRVVESRRKLDKTEVIATLNQCYESAKQQVLFLLTRQTHVTFVVDLWSEEISEKQYLTVWAYFASFALGNECKHILLTKDITSTSSKQEIISEVDKVRCDVYGSNKSYVFIFDNNLDKFRDHFDKNHLLCVFHQLRDLIRASLNSNQVIVEQINTVLKLCSSRTDLKVAETVQSLEHLNSCWFQLEILKAIDDNYDEIEMNLQQQELPVNKSSWKEISQFFSLLLNAIKTLNSSTLTWVGLWRAKLEDNCRLSDNDSPLLRSVKSSVSEALNRSQLHHPLYMVSVCLDPRFKRLKMLSEDMREKTYSYLKNAISNEVEIETLSEDFTSDIKKEAIEESSQSLPLSIEFDTTDDYPSKRLKACDALPKAFTDYLDCSDDSGKDELEIYLGLDVGQMQPQDFWNSEHGHRMPRLRSLAHRLLSVPAVPTYCQLSPLGQEFCIKRKSMNDPLFDQIFFLHIFNKIHN
ncbi:hypothetical protein B4U79_16172 [Dinothrombium tinctorium]|uniref:BED-type domain-containing protein n=1 Tax=Dinothrombium tinctorium TaxID=1965070 RepID=A0A3S4QRS4_9ACAR|nr:hypothetical protein B4U79_16172 [Dinothrombium tinctorium]